MLRPRIQGICDKCRKTLLTESGDMLIAADQLLQSGWFEINLGYGNYLHCCSEKCRVALINDLEIIPSE